MSASIYWRPRANELRIDVAAPSAFVESMLKVFGPYPWRLNFGSMGVLRGMAAMSCDGALKNPYKAIIEAIESAGLEGIEVWPEY